MGEEISQTVGKFSYNTKEIILFMELCEPSIKTNKQLISLSTPIELGVTLATLMMHRTLCFSIR